MMTVVLTFWILKHYKPDVQTHNKDPNSYVEGLTRHTDLQFYSN